MGLSVDAAAAGPAAFLAVLHDAPIRALICAAELEVQKDLVSDGFHIFQATRQSPRSGIRVAIIHQPDVFGTNSCNGWLL